MPIDCQRSTTGGKGNIGMFIERDPKVCAAGIPSAQPDDKVSDSLQHYLLKDEADALISDAIHPPKRPRPLPPLRHPIKPDMRNGSLFCDMAQLINPPIPTKYQCMADDVKQTVYSSYWNKGLGQVRDPVPMLPEGFDIEGTTFGKKTPFHGRLYDVVMPKQPLPDNTPPAKRLAVQKDRNFCRPAFNPDLTYGYRSGIDKRGTCGKQCVTDRGLLLGTGDRAIVNSILADKQIFSQSRLGTPLAPYSNFKELPAGHTFGILKRPDNLPECLTTCAINPAKGHIRKCFSHLNKVRKVLSTRYLPSFFGNLYLGLKYFDKERTGWLPNNVVYDYCGTKFIRFDPSLIEPLLVLWKAFDGDRIEYKTFVRVINYTIPSMELPKIPDFPDDCLDFRTTYTEMVKPGQPPDCSLMAGMPSGRYFESDFAPTPEGCLTCIRACLPDETDVRACLYPSIMTLTNVTHRDMYAKREPDVVRRVFENIGEEFTDESFEEIWEEAKRHHSEGWVCFETFRQALEKIRPNAA